MHKLLACMLALVLFVGTAQPQDTAFKGLVIGSSVTAVFDIETTQNGLRNCGCRERNPIYGPYPSRVRMYATNVPITVGFAFMGKWLQKRHVAVWWLPQMALTTGHGVAGTNNLIICH